MRFHKTVRKDEGRRLSQRLLAASPLQGTFGPTERDFRRMDGSIVG